MGKAALRFIFTFENMHEDIFKEVNQPQLSFRPTAKHTHTHTKKIKNKKFANMTMKTDWSVGGGQGSRTSQSQSSRTRTIETNARSPCRHSRYNKLLATRGPGHLGATFLWLQENNVPPHLDLHTLTTWNH